MKTALLLAAALVLAATGLWWLRPGETAAPVPPGAPAEPTPSAVPQAPSDRLALLVGIDRYAASPGAAIEPLEGCVNDVERMRGLLVGRFGFAPEDVLVLTDAQATHEGIVRAFDRFLIQRALPDAEVLFCFSGHGSRTPDRSGDASAEVDGMDSTYLAYDSRAEGRDGEYDLTDDELRSLVAALGERTGRITVVTDACHSGGGLRGARKLRTRSVSAGSRALDLEHPDLLQPFFPASVSLREDGEDQALHTSSIHIAACGPRQLANEIETEDEEGEPRVHGALTHFLALTLEHAPEGATFGQVAQETAHRMSDRFPGQSVWCEGQLEREVFGGGFHRRPGFEATVRPSGDLVVRAGSVHGLREGSRLAVYANLTDELLGQASVEHTTESSARATWAEDAPPPEPGRALRVVETGRPAGQPPLRIRVAHADALADVDPELVDVVSPDGELAEYELAPGPDGRLVFTTREGYVLWNEARGEELSVAVRRELVYRALLALAHEPGALQLEARFDAPTADECSRHERLSSEVRPRAGPGGVAASGEYAALGGRTGDAGRLAVIRVVNPHPHSVHLAVLSVAEDRTRTLIWPKAGQRDNKLATGASKDLLVGLFVREDWPFERPMRDRYLIVATPTFAELSGFVEGPVTRGASSEPLPPMLELALDRGRTRGPQPVDGSAWGISTIEVLVRPE